MCEISYLFSIIWHLVLLVFFFFAVQFDWEGDMPLKLSQKDLVIYEMHVRGFTRHESSDIEFPGTYQGVAEKLDHLQVQ